MRDPDLLAAAACLVAIVASEGVRVATGERLLSADLEAAAGAFVLAAFARWHMRKRNTKRGGGA